MCIISFYNRNNQVILTHNRDESISRSASSIIENRIWEGISYNAPVDLEKQGTWIFYNQDYIACILNGGKTKPIELKSEYRKSRGLILLDVMKYKSVDKFIENEDFTDVAPFTMFIHQLINGKSFLLFWDGNLLELKDLTSEQFVFRCSTTLYETEKMIELENKFHKFNDASPEDILNLHNSIKMIDGDVMKGKATTSITQIFTNNSEINMKYCPFF